jgi:hypothetical protein
MGEGEDSAQVQWMFPVPIYRGVDQKSVPAKPFGNVNNTVARVPVYRAKFGLAVRYPGNLFILATESTVESECEVSNDEISP